MNAKQKSRIVYGAALLLVLMIIGYNTWSYYAGYCTVSTLLAFSLPAKLLLVGIFVASGFLYSSKIKNRQLHQYDGCSCGTTLRDQWQFCPVCGKQRSQSSS